MHAAYIRINSSRDRLAHTLARLPDTRKSTSDHISPIPARYDFSKKNFFRMTVEPSYGREGDRFRVTVEPSYGRERVNYLDAWMTGWLAGWITIQISDWLEPSKSGQGWRWF